MYEIGVTAQFEAAHRLEGDFGPATRMHGHTYRLEAIVTGNNLRADGTLSSSNRLGEHRGSIHQVGAAYEKAPSCNGWTYWHFKRDGKLVPIPINLTTVNQSISGK